MLYTCTHILAIAFHCSGNPSNNSINGNACPYTSISLILTIMLSGSPPHTHTHAYTHTELHMHDMYNTQSY